VVAARLGRTRHCADGTEGADRDHRGAKLADVHARLLATPARGAARRVGAYGAPQKAAKVVHGNEPDAVPSRPGAR